MATLRINDLSTSLELDRKAMSSIRGGDGARWVYGWMAAFSPAIASRAEGTVNLVQTNNFITVEQMTNQFLNIAVSNAAANSNIQVAPTVVGITQKQ
jgi:hypothetical protein